MFSKRILVSLLSAACLLTTVAQPLAVFRSFSYTGNDARFDKQYDAAKQYLNPIIAGFAPDPSICRKGDTYYLVNSTFGMFPGVPIYTSKDMVSWRQLGFVLDRESQLPLANQDIGGGGIYAPQISYNEKNNTFYMITTNVGRGNFFVKTQDPAKGWSDPIYLKEVGGIDPSFFFDKNGKAYIVNNDKPATAATYDGECSIWIHEFDVENDCIIGEQKEILRGGTHVNVNPIWIEGPHLFRVGKYYYLMCAEGGTEFNHSEVILRAKNPMGPWEEYPGNPILTQRSGLDPQRPDIVTSTGHADLIQTQKGEWWAVFLGCRPYQDDFYNTGRDTYLLPVTWKDGWPTILPKNTAVPTVCQRPNLPAETNADFITGNFSYTDHFDADRLNLRWNFLRNPSSFYRLTPAGLEIKPKSESIYERKSPSAIFACQQHTSFEAETELSFVPISESNFAGFVLFQNEQHNITFGKTLLNGRPALVLTRTEKTSVQLASSFIADPTAPIRLRVKGNGRYYDFLYAEGNGPWQVIAKGVDAVNLSTRVAGGFIGAYIGLYAKR